jgi:dienelactone hydrolase/lysophospholipase L1-like esterase
MKSLARPLVAILLLLLTLQLPAREPAPRPIWDLKHLSRTPKADWGETRDLVQEVFYAGEPFGGKPTRVFAYVGRPEGEGPFPGVVLVHGGGGRAFEDWARHWAKRGYVSISMDTAGNGPEKKRLEDGGPNQNDAAKFRNFTEDEAKEMWTYHAVSDVILAHSLLRSLPECDSGKTALTGISWGGYLTCITAGIDSRFKAAAPVYGCGFLHDNSAWRDKQIAAMEEDSRRRWIQLFDPGQLVGQTRRPILFLNGTSDFAYPLDSYRKTIEQVKPKLATTAIHLKLPHGHIWTFKIVDTFIDSVLRGGPGLAQIGEIRVSGGVATARILTDTKVAGAELLYSTDEGAWPSREWKTVGAKVADGAIRAKLPEDRPIAFFLQATDTRGLKTSSNHANLIRPGDAENHAVVPMPKLEQDAYDWYGRHAEVLRIKDEIDPAIVLIGDSISHGWGGRPIAHGQPKAPDSWAELFGERSMNLGFGWDRTQNVLWRIDHGELDGISPKAVVIHIGVNNLTGTKNHVAGTPAQVAEGIDAVCARVRGKLPEAEILLMAVFPRGERPNSRTRAKVAEINALLPAVAEKHQAELIDITGQLLDEKGVYSKELARDFLHPTAAGYQIWADALRPLLSD